MKCEEKIGKLLRIIERVANKEYERDNWRTILDDVADLFEADGAALGEIKDGYIYYTRVSSSILGSGLYDPENFKVPVWWSAFSEALLKGYLIVNDYRAYERAVEAWKKAGLKTKLVAILGTDEPFGSLSVGRVKSEKPFTEEDGKILKSLAFIFSFIVKEEMEKEELMEKAIRDYLTKLYNRLFLEEEGRREIERAKRYNYPISLIMFDLDDFKRINDEYGHSKGDEILIRFAQVLRSRVRKTDIPVRLGGEEFVVLLPHTCLEDAVNVAERVRSAFENMIFRFDSSVVRLTVSAGIACCDPVDCGLDTLLYKADKAMYKAKREGKNKVEVFV